MWEPQGLMGFGLVGGSVLSGRCVWGRVGPGEEGRFGFRLGCWRVRGGGSAELGEASDAGEGGVVGGGPWPSGG